MINCNLCSGRVVADFQEVHTAFLKVLHCPTRVSYPPTVMSRRRMVRQSRCLVIERKLQELFGPLGNLLKLAAD